MTLPTALRAVLIYGAAALAAYFVFFNEKPKTPAAQGWDKLEPCSEATSIDSKKTLSLSEDQTAEVADRSDDKNTALRKGKWELWNAESHVYVITIEGVRYGYIVVSPDDSEGCILAAGTNIDRVDLRQSWFSARVDPPGPDRNP